MKSNGFIFKVHISIFKLTFIGDSFFMYTHRWMHVCVCVCIYVYLEFSYFFPLIFVCFVFNCRDIITPILELLQGTDICIRYSFSAFTFWSFRIKIPSFKTKYSFPFLGEDFLIFLSGFRYSLLLPTLQHHLWGAIIPLCVWLFQKPEFV